VKHFKILSSSC